MRRILITGLLAVFAVFGLASPAFAHDVKIGSNPPDGAQLATGPSTVEIDFNAPVQNGPNTITVIGPDGQHWEKTENATVNGDAVSTPVAPLGPAGVYAIGYRVISADGHPVAGVVRFTLTTAGTGKPVNPENSTTSGGSGGSGGGVPIWVWIVGAVVLLGIGLVVVLRMSGSTEDAKR